MLSPAFRPVHGHLLSGGHLLSRPYPCAFAASALSALSVLIALLVSTSLEAEEAKPPEKSILEILKNRAEEKKKAEAEKKAAEGEKASEKAPAKEGEKPAEKPAAKPAEKPGEKEKPAGEAPKEGEMAAKAAAGEPTIVVAPGQQGQLKVKVVAGEEAQAAAQPAPAAGETAKAQEEPKSAEPPKAKEEPKQPAAPKEPQPPMFRLRDGTRLTGTPDLKDLNVTTAYGKLVIPVSEVLRVRFAAAKDTGIDANVAEHIAALGSAEFDTREEAVEKLREIGLPALDALKEALKSDDAEVKTRVEKLIAEIEENTEEEDDPELATLSPIIGVDDEVVTVKFTVMGHIEESSVALSSRYGDLRLSRNDIVSIVFQEIARLKRSFKVPGSNFAAANKWMVTDLELTQGEPIRIAASGTINLENFGRTCGPEGASDVSGNQFESFPTGSLVARIGDKGKAFQVGPEFEGAANATGKIQFAISLQNGRVSGEFQVDVETEAAP